MTVILKPEQEKVLMEAVKSGLARTPDDALDQAFEALRGRLPGGSGTESGVADAARRLGTFGKRHNLSLGDLTVKELLHESRP